MVGKESFSNKMVQKRLKKRIYSYLFEMKPGEENKVVTRIVQDIEVLTLQQRQTIMNLEHKIVMLKEGMTLEAK